MVNIKGKHIYLRALELEDLDFIYNVENDTSLWHLGDAQTPYSRLLLKQYLENAKQDIYEAKQLRLAICLNDHNTIGLIDVFDFNAKNKRAGIGIVIKEPEHRNLGFGKEALNLLVAYCFEVLYLHQVYANIAANNESSLALFKSSGFEEIGLKKEWCYNGKDFNDEYILQRINN